MSTARLIIQERDRLHKSLTQKGSSEMLMT